jgi:L-alanine-DL-glutamate epimerase-like enolase superfamily enzyme
MEEGATNTADYKDLFAGGWKPNLASWDIPDAPGLGIDISPEFLRDHQIKPA